MHVVTIWDCFIRVYISTVHKPDIIALILYLPTNQQPYTGLGSLLKTSVNPWKLPWHTPDIITIKLSVFGYCNLIV